MASIDPPCRLLELPPELRNRIYEYAFSDNNEAKDHIDLLVAQPPEKSLLLSCRQIYKEAEGLYKEAYRRYWSTSFFFTDFKPSVSDFHRPVIAALRPKNWDHITRLTLTCHFARRYEDCPGVPGRYVKYIFTAPDTWHFNGEYEGPLGDRKEHCVRYWRSRKREVGGRRYSWFGKRPAYHGLDSGLTLAQKVDVGSEGGFREYVEVPLHVQILWLMKTLERDPFTGEKIFY